MTMNLKIIIIALFVCSIQIKAQQRIEPVPASYPKNTNEMTTVDSASIRVWYAFNATDIKNTKTYEDYQCLEIGKHINKYYSYFVYSSDSTVSAWRQKNKAAKAIPRSSGNLGRNGWIEYKYSEFFTYKGIFREYTNMPMYMDRYNCYSEEQTPKQEWQFVAETATIMGVICQKAICKFRGREYMAWFAPAIPINSGPWKFGGLPGLILKVQDTDAKYVFECIGMTYYKKEKSPIKMYTSYEKRSKKERKELLTLQKKIREDYWSVAGIVFQNKQPAKVNYSPMELE